MKVLMLVALVTHDSEPNTMIRCTQLFLQHSAMVNQNTMKNAHIHSYNVTQWWTKKWRNMCTFVLTMHDNGKPEHNDEICKK
jgi:hypothetical protein